VGLAAGEESAKLNVMLKIDRNVPSSIKVNLLDQTFGEWTVIGFAGRGPSADIRWLCRCSSGHIGTVSSGNLRSGESTKCRTCGTNGPKRKYGEYLASDPLCRAWRKAMREGACKAWHNLDSFIRGMGPKPSYAGLVRRDDRKPHSPENSYWHSKQNTIAEQVDELVAHARPPTKAAEEQLRKYLTERTRQFRHRLLKRVRQGEPVFRRASLNRRFGLS